MEDIFMNYDYLLYLAIILFSTKLLGLITRKAHMPQVVGALLAGLLLGPACFGLLHGSTFLNQISEIGVIVLMFIGRVGVLTLISSLIKQKKITKYKYPSDNIIIN